MDKLILDWHTATIDKEIDGWMHEQVNNWKRHLPVKEITEFTSNSTWGKEETEQKN